jgi:hypothetical protein
MRRKGSVIDDFFNMDVLFGILLGIAATMLLTTSRWFAARGLEHYQELLSGCFALIGAAAAVVVVNRQIRHAQEMENERRKRREYAARKMLPQSLSAMTKYAISVYEDDLLITLRIPPISGLEIEPARQLLEFGERDIQDRLSELIRLLQIQQSRLSPGVGDADPQDWVNTQLADALELHARANMLFDYAYASEEQRRAPGPLNLDQIRNSAALLGSTDSELNSLHQSVGRRWN